MVEEGGEVDDDFLFFERIKFLVLFVIVNNVNMRVGVCMCFNLLVYDDFVFVLVLKDEYEENKLQMF